MLKPHDEVYNGSKYRFALLDGILEDINYRFSALNRSDFYDLAMPNCRFTNINLDETLMYRTGMDRSRFYYNWISDCDFRYTIFERNKFTDVSLKDCIFFNCDLEGMTIDGINIKRSIEIL